jgi:Holliday junction resolvasome RuvABC ATP-dependent DNA helicase subunit
MHLNVDAEGLDEMDNKILRTIIEKFKGGPCRNHHHCYSDWRREAEQLKRYTNLT